MPSPQVQRATGHGAAPYIVAAVATQVVGHGVRRVDGFPGPEWMLPLAILAVGTALSVVLWVRCDSHAEPPRLFRAFLALAFVLTLTAMLRATLRQESYALDAVSALLLVLFVWIKPPAATDARRVVDGVAGVLALTALAAMGLEVLGLMASWYGTSVEGIATRQFDMGYYWLPLQGVLGIDGRWAGPFPHPNHAGPVGALLLVVGVTRSGWRRWSFVSVGLLILILTASRASIIAALAGTVTVLGVMWAARLRHQAAAVPAIAYLVPASLLALLGISAIKAASVAEGDQLGSVVATTGSLMGRTEVWGAYWQLWVESPVLGVAKQRVLEAFDAGLIPYWARGSAHNLVLDYLARTGIVGTGLLVACLVVVALMAVGAARRGSPVAIGLVVVLAAGAVTEALIVWELLATSTVILWVAAVASLDRDTPRKGASARGPVTEPPRVDEGVGGG